MSKLQFWAIPHLVNDNIRDVLVRGTGFRGYEQLTWQGNWLPAELPIVLRARPEDVQEDDPYMLEGMPDDLLVYRVNDAIVELERLTRKLERQWGLLTSTEINRVMRKRDKVLLFLRRSEPKPAVKRD